MMVGFNCVSLRYYFVVKGLSQNSNATQCCGDENFNIQIFTIGMLAYLAKAKVTHHSSNEEGHKGVVRASASVFRPEKPSAVIEIEVRKLRKENKKQAADIAELQKQFLHLSKTVDLHVIEHEVRKRFNQKDDAASTCHPTQLMEDLRSPLFTQAMQGLIQRPDVPRLLELRYAV